MPSQIAARRDVRACSRHHRAQVPRDGLRYSRGGRQGGAETPELWKRVLNVALPRAKARWDLLGFPAVFVDRDSPEDRCDIDLLAWADDLALFSNTVDGIHSMFKILDEELHRVYLSIKPGSLESVALWQGVDGQGVRLGRRFWDLSHHFPAGKPCLTWGRRRLCRVCGMFS